MKIHWNENPLKTAVEVDDRDRLMILYYLQAEEYSNLLCELDLTLRGAIRKDEPPLTIGDVAQKISEWGSICNMDIKHEEIDLYASDLLHQHAGDCTCLPASCSKCRAEEALGINTIKGLGKHSASKIQGLFAIEGSSIDTVLNELSKKKEYNKPDNWPNSMRFEEHIPRWEKEREAAYNWLKVYKEEHGF